MHHPSLRFQPVDATHLLNRPAVISKSDVFLGRPPCFDTYEYRCNSQ